LLIVPTAGLRLQVTVVFEVLATVAVNCCVWAANRVPAAGATDTLIGDRATDTLTGRRRAAITLMDAAGFPATVALTVTIWEERTDAGAVEKPALPTAGLKLHSTPFAKAPNCPT
jgi:hypothetical protein